MPASTFNPDTASICTLASGEPLLIRDWLDGVRDALLAAGYEDIQKQVAESGFDWDSLLEEGDMLSLFSNRKCRIVHIVNARPGVSGARVIQALCENPPQDSLYIFVLPGLEKQARKSAWFQSLQRSGEVIEPPPVFAEKLPEWIRQRAAMKGLQIDDQSAEFLAERTEGNLLAADQELEKLSMRFGSDSSIGFESIEESVSQSARYSHFVLVDACLAGRAGRAFRILDSLKKEGFVTPQIRWAIQGALEQLSRLRQAQSDGNLGDRVWQALRIWRGKQRLYLSALSRLDQPQIERLLQSCATLDRVGKGQQDNDFPGQDWLQLKTLIGGFCGLRSML